MRRQTQSDEISFFTFLTDLKGYKLKSFLSDAYAAITVSMLTLPQAMAYAMLAGLPISCGLFAGIYSALIASIFGSSKHLIVGSSNAIAILVQAGISEILYTYYRDINPAEKEMLSIQILTTLTLLVGFFQILAAGLKLGRLSHFISHSVVIGYIVGTTTAVVINQSFTLLGIPRMAGVHSLYERGVYLIVHLYEFHLPTALIGLFSLMTIIFLKRINKKIPAAFITLCLAGAFVHLADSFLSYFGENFFWFSETAKTALEGIERVGDTGVFSEIVPKVDLPSFDIREMNALLPTAFAIAVLSIMETSSAAKSVAANSGQRLSNNQEIFGMGLGNLTSSLISAMPVAGSPSRSTINFQSGAETRVSALLNVFFVMMILIVFSFFLKVIPIPALSALLLITSFSVINKNQLLLCLKATRSDAMVLGVTIFSCIFFSFDIAFYIGVGMSITLYLKKAAIPQLVEYEVDEDGHLKNLSYYHTHQNRHIRLIKVEGELFFGAADLFQSTLKAIAEDDNHTKVIILHLKNARDIDATVCLALQQLKNYLQSSHRHLLACGLTEPIWYVLNDSGLIDKLGKDNLFPFDERYPDQFLKKAIERAKELLEEGEEKEIVEGVSSVEEEVPLVESPIIEFPGVELE